MMTSFSPGANIRAAIMRNFSWIWALTGSTPRMGRLYKVSPAGINTCSVNSGETSGFPTPSRLMAGKNLSASNWSSVMNELASEPPPLPIRIMLSDELLSLIADPRPPPIATPAQNIPHHCPITPKRTNHAFANEQTQDDPRGKSYRAHCRDFAPALANGHRPLVCRDQPNCHDGHRAEQLGQFHENTIATQKPANCRCFRNASCFCRGIGELVIKRGTNFRNHP